MNKTAGMKESEVGDVLAVLTTDKGSKVDIPKWIGKAGHNLVGVFTRDGFDEIVVEKVR